MSESHHPIPIPFPDSKKHTPSPPSFLFSEYPTDLNECPRSRHFYIHVYIHIYIYALRSCAQLTQYRCLGVLHFSTDQFPRKVLYAKRYNLLPKIPPSPVKKHIIIHLAHPQRHCSCLSDLSLLVIVEKTGVPYKARPFLVLSTGDERRTRIIELISLRLYVSTPSFLFLHFCLYYEWKTNRMVVGTQNRASSSSPPRGRTRFHFIRSFFTFPSLC